MLGGGKAIIVPYSKFKVQSSTPFSFELWTLDFGLWTLDFGL
jgi:hypothetical protein